MSTTPSNVSSGTKKPIVLKGSVWIDDDPSRQTIFAEIAEHDSDNFGQCVRIGFCRTDPTLFSVEGRRILDISRNGVLQVWPPTQPPDINIDLLDALGDIHCPDCDHSLRHHADEYGCEVERDDKWVEGQNCGGMVAQGPCHCKCEDHPDLQVAINLIRRIKAQKGGTL